MAEAVTFNTLSLSYKASCFVLNACGTITEEHRHLLPRTDDDRRFLADPLNGGGSSVIGATSRVLSGPMPGDEQGLLLAELDLHDCVRAKVVHDYSGHYNRADVFTLEVRAPSHRLLRRLDGAGVGL